MQVGDGHVTAVTGAKGAPLDYAPAPKRRRRLMRWILTASVLLTLGIIAFKWGSDIRQHVVVYYLQWRCLHHSLPADQLVFDSSPESTQSLSQQRGYSKIQNGPAVVYEP